MVHHIWCEHLVYRVQKWVTKRVLTDKMIRMQYGLQTRIQYMLARTACAGPGFVLSSKFLDNVRNMADHIWCESLCMEVNKWVMKR